MCVVHILRSTARHLQAKGTSSLLNVCHIHLECVQARGCLCLACLNAAISNANNVRASNTAKPPLIVSRFPVLCKCLADCRRGVVRPPNYLEKKACAKATAAAELLARIPRESMNGQV